MIRLLCIWCSQPPLSTLEHFELQARRQTTCPWAVGLSNYCTVLQRHHQRHPNESLLKHRHMSLLSLSLRQPQSMNIAGRARVEVETWWEVEFW